MNKLTGIESTEIKNSVNLTIDQADLVDMMVEDLKDELEKKVKNLRSSLKLMNDKYDALTTKLEEYLKGKASNGMIRKTKKFCDENKIAYKEDIRFEWKDRIVGEVHMCDVRYIQANYKNPVRIYQEKESNVKFNTNTPAKIHHKVYPPNKPDGYPMDGITCTVSGSVAIDKAAQKILDEREAVIKEKLSVIKELYLEEVSLMKVDTGEKRFKSQFLKATLGKSKEGKQVLDLIEGVKKGTKLLS